jgi:hypothetical protein
MLAQPQVVEYFGNELCILAERGISRDSGLKSHSESGIQESVAGDILKHRDAGPQINVIETFLSLPIGYVPLVGNFDFQRKYSKSLFDFASDDFGVLTADFGVQPVQAGFVNLEIRVIDEERFRKDSLAVSTSTIEQTEEPKPGAGLLRGGFVAQRAGEGLLRLSDN